MSLFFLTEQQEKVFRHLTDEQLSVTSLAKLVKLPRTSVAKALLRLEEIGLAKGRKVREKNKHLYQKISDEELNKKIEELRSLIFEKPMLNKKTISHHKESPVVFYQGKDSILEALHEMLSIRRNERIYIVQGKDAVHSWLTYIGEENVLGIHKRVLENELILVSIRSESLKKEIGYHEKLNESIKGRLTRTHSLSDDFFQEKISVYAFRDSLLFVNLKKGFAIKIADFDIAHSYIKLISFVVNGAKREI